MTQASNHSIRVRQSNRATILSLIASYGKIQRVDLARSTGLTLAAISRITRDLLDDELISEIATKSEVNDTRPAGRPGTFLRMKSGGAYCLAVTLTANRMSVALFDSSLNEGQSVHLSNFSKLTPDAVLETLIKGCNRLISDANIAHQELVGIGIVVATHNIGSTGLIDVPILDWSQVAITQKLEDALNLPVAIDTRSAGFLRLERLKNPVMRTTGSFLINVGVGIGTAGCFGNERNAIDFGAFGSLSHLRHPDNFAMCNCGRKGCLEQCASGAGVVQQYFGSRTQGLKFTELAPKLSQVINAAEENEQSAIDAFYSAGIRLAHGVDCVATLFTPSTFILSGETGRQPDFLNGLRAGLCELGRPDLAQSLRVTKANSSTAAAVVALDAFLFQASARSLRKAA